ncbi:MAG TPA: hypothetical protein PKM39_03455 [Pseudothauera hydrothermalis]|nr:hypothetical protein [Pseudothauera hydrothermalis]
MTYSDTLLDKQTLRAYLVTGLGLGLLFALSVPLDETARIWLLKEGGAIETLSAVLYLVCAAYMLSWAQRARAWPYVVLMVLFAMREADFDKRFTEVGVLKSKFLFSPLVPLHQKLIGGAVLALALYVLVTIVRRDGLSFVRALHARSVEAWGRAVAILLVLASKALDGVGRKLADMGIVLDPVIDLHAGALEEVLELGIGIFILLACRLKFRRTG